MTTEGQLAKSVLPYSFPIGLTFMNQWGLEQRSSFFLRELLVIGEQEFLILSDGMILSLDAVVSIDWHPLLAPINGEFEY